MKAEWKISDTNSKVRMYRITPAGVKHLEHEVFRFERMLEGISLVLAPAKPWEHIMSWPNRIFRRRSFYSDLAEEIRQHLEERTEHFLREGLPRKEAEQAARRAFGNLTLIEERSREIWQWSTLASVWSDLKYARRQLYKHLEFTGIAMLTIAIGIAANVSVFSFVNALFLRTVPAKDPSRLVRVFAPRSNVEDDKPFSYPEYTYLRQHTHTLESLTAHYSTAPLVQGH